MSYRVITLCLESYESTEQLTTVAAIIAGSVPTHVQTIHVLPAGYEFVSLSPYIQGVPLSRLYDQYEDIAEEIKQSYLACQAQHANTITWDWQRYDGFTLSDFDPYVKQAMVSDLVVCSKPPNISLGAALPRTLIRESGTPVLVVPDGIKINLPFERITVAWNETAESARAIRDSLPLLKQAKEVYVLNLSKKEDQNSVKGLDIGRYLGEHKIQVEIDQMNSTDNIGSELLKHVNSNFCDLLVMGGFGHSSLHNLVLGSATPEVLKKLSCPVFMSH